MSEALIIDDNRATADALLQMLNLFGMQARVAYGSSAALTVLSSFTPGLILLDITMPGVDGLEVLGFLRREPRLGSIPVVVITLDDQPETRERAFKRGANALIIKPATLDALEVNLKKLGVFPGETPTPASGATLTEASARSPKVENRGSPRQTDRTAATATPQSIRPTTPHEIAPGGAAKPPRGSIPPAARSVVPAAARHPQHAPAGAPVAAPAPIRAGLLAPDFELQDDEGIPRRLSAYRGRPLILYFYPADDTPGCTKEACNFRDDYSAYIRAGLTILGVSPDGVESHRKFKKKYGLPFPLLADVNHRVCARYGVWGRKQMMGRTYEGVLRTTFLIDGTGRIVRVFERVRPAEHSAQLLEALKAS